MRIGREWKSCVPFGPLARNRYEESPSFMIVLPFFQAFASRVIAHVDSTRLHDVHVVPSRHVVHANLEGEIQNTQWRCLMCFLR